MVVTPVVVLWATAKLRPFKFDEVLKSLLAQAGACVVGVVSLYSSLVQLAISDAMRGRVMSIFMLAFRGGMPLGSLAAGWIAQRWSIAAALTMNGTVLAIVALLFFSRGRYLDRDLSPAAA